MSDHTSATCVRPRLDVALEALANGYHVFPCGTNKRPLTLNGWKDASTDPEVIGAWWAAHPDAMPSIAVCDGVVMLDFDSKPERGLVADEVYMRLGWSDLPATYEERTGGGGFHLWFQYPEEADMALGIGAGLFGIPGFDMRSNGGYSCIHIDTAPPPRAQLAPLPMHYHALLPRHNAKHHHAAHPVELSDFADVVDDADALDTLNAVADKLTTTARGTRNDAANAQGYIVGLHVAARKLRPEVALAVFAYVQEKWTAEGSKDHTATFVRGLLAGAAEDKGASIAGAFPKLRAAAETARVESCDTRSTAARLVKAKDAVKAAKNGTQDARTDALAELDAAKAAHKAAAHEADKAAAKAARAPTAPSGVNLSTSQSGEVRANVTNTTEVLMNDPAWAGVFHYDCRSLEVRFSEERMEQVRAVLKLPTRATNVIEDKDLTGIRIWIQDNHQFEPSKETLEHALVYTAEQDSRNPLVDHLEDCREDYDGIPRLDLWLTDYLGVEDSPLHRMYARRTIIAACARAIPQQEIVCHCGGAHCAGVHRAGVGCKVDTVLVLQGPQGERKSTLLKDLAGEDYFSDSKFDISNKDSYITIRKPWIYECAELTSLTKSAVEEVKAFLTSASDNFRAPYERISKSHPRQGIFVGSTEKDTFLMDPAGSRRFWPVRVGTIQTSGFRSIVPQLIGEAMTALYAGERWWLEKYEEAIRAEEAEQFTVEDPWVASLAAWFKTRRVKDATFTLAEAMQGLLVNQADYSRLGTPVTNALKAIGCNNRRFSKDGQRATVWTPPAHLSTPAPITAVPHIGCGAFPHTPTNANAD